MFVAFRRWPMLTLLLLAALVAPSLADISRQTILATGDRVPEFGAIGGGGFDIKALTDDGRLLVAATLSDGRQGLFYADHRQLTPIWTSDQAPGVRVGFFAATAQASGAVVVPAWVPGAALPFFYVFTPAGEVHVVHPSSPDRGGNNLCGIDTRRTSVNASGDIAFQAEIAPPGRDCDSYGDSIRPSAIYVARGDQITRAITVLDFSTSLAAGDFVALVGLTDDGTVVATHQQRLPSGRGDVAVISVKSGTVRRIVGTGDVSPSGELLLSLQAVVANAAGDVAFTTGEGNYGLYRTQAGRIVPVATLLEAPSGSLYRNLDRLAGFNDAGDIAFSADWSTHKSDGSYDDGKGVVLYSADGREIVLFAAGRDTEFGRYATAAGSLALNEHGAVAFTVSAYDGDAALRGVTWSEGTLVTALASGDAGPDATVVAEGGLSWYSNLHCLAPDGRVATAANSTTGHQGVVCVDADGRHLVVQSGTLAPDGFAFTDFAGCTFTDDGALIFSGSRAVPMYSSQQLVSQAAVYRADATGIERLYGDGDTVSNGTRIPDNGSGTNFVANARGSVLALAGGVNDGLFLRHGGSLDVVRYGDVLQWGLADNDDVAIIARLGGWQPPDYPTTDRPTGNAIIVWSNGRTQIVAQRESTTSSAFRGFTNLAVRGELVLFTALGDPGQPDRSYFYRLGDAEPREVPAAVVASYILDFTPGGRILQRLAGGYGVLNPDGTSGSFLSNTPDVMPFGINDRGNIALYSTRETAALVELVGPAPDGSAHCPVPPAAPATPQSNTPTPTPTAPPVLGSGPYRAYVSDVAGDRVMVIDTATQELLASIIVSHRPTGLAASPDGRRIFVLADSKVDVIDAAALQVVRSVVLGEYGVNIIAGPDNATALVGASISTTGGPRIILVDADAGLATSIPSRAGRIFGLDPSGTQVFSTSTSGAPCDSTSRLVESNLLTSEVVGSTEAGRSATAGAVSTDGTRAYAVDACTNQLLVVDLASFSVTGRVTVDQTPDNLAVTADGARAYITHSYYSYSANPDGSYANGRAFLSVVDLTAGTSETVSLTGSDRSQHVALTPDGRLAYVTVGSVAVLDTQTKTQLTTLLPTGGAGDVVVAPVPDAAAPSPTPRGARVILRAQDVSGILGDDVPINVGIESGGLAVASIEHDLITTWNSPVQGTQAKRPDCRLAPGMAAVATFEIGQTCTVTCDRVHVRIHATEPGGSLPDRGILYTCTARISYPYQPSRSPILIDRATAADAAGNPLPVFGAESGINVLSRDEATPRPTRTRTVTATRTASPTPTPTRPPVVIEVGSATLAAGSQATIAVTLHANGATVVAAQNEVSFPATAPIAATAPGRPQCAVNPTIGKPNTSFAFVPAGCDSAQRACTGVRAIVLSLDDVNPIADQSVLYTCVVEAPPTAAVGVFALRTSAVHVSDPSGGLLPAIGVDGSVSVTSVAPTATNIPTAVLALTPSPTSTPDAGDSSGHTAFSAGSQTTTGGCNVSPSSPGSGALAVYGLVILALGVRRPGRRRRQ